MTLIAEIAGVDRLVDLGCLEALVWDLDVVEELVENVVLLVLHLTLKLSLDVLEDGLDGVAVGIA